MIWWLPLAFAVPCFFIWTTVHEGAHALSAMAEGRNIKSFKPWPHKAGDNWYFGRVLYDKPSEWTFTSLAPYWFDLVAFVGLAVGLWFVGAEGYAGTAMITVIACPLVNTATAVYGRFRSVRRPDLAKVSWGWASPFFFLLLLYCGAVGVIIGRML